MTRPQIIYDNDRPAFVVVPIEEYLTLNPDAKALLTDEEMYDRAVARDDGTRIPHEVVKRLALGESPVKVYREWRNLLQQELADKAGVSVGYISQVERGVRTLSRKMQAEMARILAVDYEDLEPGEL
jgi:DNA-binding XRE family transcriptional regulator